ncbi:ead/Ea22-like family protein [Burkholderia vietnamiensis]|uniref:ead/Ea22-like family protein n=1 Tax=Burkholderia vietnamiensis TaxID=60552 RepID=UPI001CF5CDA0|nr:ead/Ea22-like family protein [Burkholderia vietnamiensis]MCA8447541.1 ead/Ea22-like family protein [Burkholderia vietnamiensis]HDR8953398.1 ead/Ea22-like family protein [Burkholderia vietnamiensis]
MIDQDKMRALAKAAPGGGWETWASNSWRRVYAGGNPAITPCVHPNDNHPDLTFAPGVREWIEAATPDAIVALLDKMDAMESENNRLRAELEATAADKRAAKKPDAMTKAVKQLADWLLTDPNEGNPLCFAGPPEPFVLGLSRVKMRSIAGDEWTLIAGLQEGWLNAEQRAANFWRIAKLEREEVAREEAVAALAQRQGEGS